MSLRLFFCVYCVSIRKVKKFFCELQNIASCLGNNYILVDIKSASSSNDNLLSFFIFFYFEEESPYTLSFRL